MDLVDIDQVLDNLELREAADEQSKSFVAATVGQAKPPFAKGNNGEVLATIHSTVGRLNDDSICSSSSNNGKGFVGVSQVFNSLDDYRNNVKDLEIVNLPKYDEECRLITSAMDETDNNSLVENQMQIKEEIITGSAAFKEDAANTNNTDEDVDDVDNDTDGSGESSCDIHKFVEKADVLAVAGMTLDGRIDNTISSSDSLTTSSSSTFSSGPSPGIISTEEHSLGLSPLAVSEEPLTNEVEICLTKEEHLQYVTNQNLDSPDEEPKTVLEEIAVGLSSISITNTDSQSIVPCEATASSAFGNILRNLSDTQTSSMLLHPRDYIVPEEISVELIIPNDGLDDELASVVHNKFNMNRKQLPNGSFVQLYEAPKQLQPITFCSTMDDISDTELDSMLQEMDIDDVSEENFNKPIKISSEPSNEPIVKCTAVEQDIVAIKPETTAEAEAVQNSLDNNINEDSFSQASTVEFSEIKAQAVAHEDVASSYTSTDSDSSDLAGDGDSVEHLEDYEENAGLRPQRPTTLDLPAINMNLYANAGQTPPGVNMLQNKMQAENISNADGQEEGTGVQAHETNSVDCEASTTGGGELEQEPNEIAEATGYSDPHENLGKIPPIWVPDNMAAGCMQCQSKFTMIKRRHHCRSCGKVLCSVCCSQRFKLEFLTETDSRICVQCYLILTQRQEAQPEASTDEEAATQQTATPTRSPNPNNPMEYCSMIPPHRQVNVSSTSQPPSVIVPVGVLKKDGSYSSTSSNSSGKKGRKRKSVMFSDGIAPGSDLASSLEQQWGEAKHARRINQGDKKANKPPTPATASDAKITDATTLGLVAQLFRGSIPPIAAASTITAAQSASEQPKSSGGTTDARSHSSKFSSPLKKADQRTKKLPPSDTDDDGCYIPTGDNYSLPPICPLRGDGTNCDFDYKEIANDFNLVERLQRETLKFAVKKNFFVLVKIVNLSCCMNRTVINFTTCGMHYVGNDEIIILLEYKPPAAKEDFTEPALPKDIFEHLHEIYRDAELGRPIAELSFSSPKNINFLGSREYGGFLFIRNSFQCLQDVIVPESPFLIAILIHRHEVPWAKVFPLRLMLRLGAQYRYYPCPHISMRNRESVYAEIAQTIINFLADFRNYTYTLPSIRGLYIHMEDRQTTVLIPRNRQDDIIKAINNASDHILAFAGNFSKTADGHLVCMQNVNDNESELYSYSTQAINIQGQPRRVTGASFFVLNEALKSSSGLSGKCSIVEDGLMVQILPTKMEEVRNALRNQTDINIVCGPLDADEQQTEVVSIKWVDNDRDFNVGVISPIDAKSMEGISSMRVHASFNYSNANYAIRLTDIYIIKFDDWYNGAPGTVVATSAEVTRLAEQIARSASTALVPFLDLLAASGSYKIGLRVTLHQENVCYEAGTRGSKLPPLYMNALDNNLIPTLHNESNSMEDAIILELIFYILKV